MRVYLNEKIDANIDGTDIKCFDDTKECDSIVREVYDNEYVALNVWVLGDKKSETLLIDYAIDKLANNLNKDDLPKDVEIVIVLSRDIVTYKGYRESRPITVSNEKYTPLYIGIDASYLGDKSNVSLTLTTESGMRTINVELVKNGHMLHNKGADKNKHMARLMWLNSTLFRNNKKSYIYEDLEVENDTIKMHGKDVELSSDGYIKNVKSYIDDNLNLTDNIQNELLDGGIRLDVGDNIVYEPYKIERNGANLIIHIVGEGDNVKVCGTCKVKYEGSFYYNIDVIAKKDIVIDVEQISMYASSASKYMSGLGYAGGSFAPCNFKWNKNYEDSLFVGDINVGARIRWQGDTDDLPYNKMMYRYKPLITPESWDNGAKGGIDVLYERERARVNAYTGKVSLVAGEKKTYRYSVHITPYREINIGSHLSNRIYMNNKIYSLSDKKVAAMADKHDATTIALMNNKEIYKYINYPIKKGEELQDFTYSEEHKDVNLMYNLKDVSLKSKDIVAFKNIGDIVYSTKDAELQKNVPEDFKKKMGSDTLMGQKTENDMSVMMQPLSRYDNYYVEMVNWLAKECKIKGITLEDALLSRTTIERVRKVLDRYKGNIEHITSCTMNNKMGSGSSLVNNAEILPFVDRNIVGKGYNMKNMSPYEILVEASGLTYGVPSECLDTDVFLGMLYGMYARDGYNTNSNKKLDKLLSKFDIKNSKMVGFWSRDALHAKDEGIKITYYVCGKKALICMYNFNNYPAVSNVDYSPLHIKGTMKSFPMSKLIMNQKFNTNTTVVLYTKCGVFIEADLD